METNQIDITNAKTEKELNLESVLLQVLTAWQTEANWGDGIHEKHMQIFNRGMKLVKSRNRKD